ncbi:putative transcriptional regulator [Desulfitobacterium dichloroeliminans LMG P-21439]|uniref:Putative transcriptional regulator n=1 Tax=Desulfitobacterium dichloroeliminans (strain LMG P-21439 / DCA1) TaxID=871963 RepID=L0F757_DESDL|nr:metalloregulator ArsR/SmtB family transcription factor [Desulfitobacterium dichloroeliminans]AGA68486.1 putative transcriptional regulator [Desulfitobacterium dichloroeliminans LMG P-21439]
MDEMQTLESLVEELKVLGDKTRLRIISLLRNRELCVCDLTEVLEISQPGVSQQMRRLRQSGLAKERRGGQWTYYSLNEENHCIGIILPMIPVIKEDEERLKEFLEGKEKERRILNEC